MLTIGFAGSAKNTGKTTAALHVLSLCDRRGLQVALTSIGYDGENLDNVTGLPKPRYYVQPGHLVATAERCLKAGTAQVRHVAQTGIHTVLGQVQVVEVTHPGSVVLAGPNRSRDLRYLLEILQDRQAGLAILDGALNRLVPLIVSDGLVFSTGAAFDEVIPHIAGHAGAAGRLFQLPVEPAANAPTGIQIYDPAGRLIQMPDSSLLSPAAVQTMLEALPVRVSRLVLPGACYPQLLETLLAAGKKRLDGCRFVFGSPFHLLAAGDPCHWQRILAALPARGQSAACLQTVPLRLVTVNPFFPRHLPSGRYQADCVDKDRLLAAVQARLSAAPVVNVRETAGFDLLSTLGLSLESAHA